MNHFFLVTNSGQTHSPSVLFFMFLQRRREIFPPKFWSHSASYWKPVPHNVISGKKIEHACFFCFFFAWFLSSYSSQKSIFRERRNGKWGRFNTERHIGDICKNHRASVMFIVHRKHLFLLQLNIFECG